MTSHLTNHAAVHDTPDHPAEVQVYPGSHVAFAWSDGGNHVYLNAPDIAGLRKVVDALDRALWPHEHPEPEQVGAIAGRLLRGVGRCGEWLHDLDAPRPCLRERGHGGEHDPDPPVSEERVGEHVEREKALQVCGRTVNCEQGCPAYTCVLPEGHDGTCLAPHKLREKALEECDHPRWVLDADRGWTICSNCEIDFAGYAVERKKALAHPGGDL